MYSRMALVLLRLGLQRLMQMATSRAKSRRWERTFLASCDL